MLIRIRCYNCETWNLYDFNENQVGDVFECKDCKAEIADITEKTRAKSRNEIYYVFEYTTPGIHHYVKKWIQRIGEGGPVAFILIPKDFTIGTPGAVRFNGELAMDMFKKGTLAGFYHEHPGSSNPMPSTTDHKTMRSWVIATDTPLICAIGNGKGLIHTWIVWGEDGLDKDGKTITVLKAERLDTLAEGENGTFAIEFYAEEDFKKKDEVKEDGNVEA